MRNMNALLKELNPEGYDALVNEGVERLNALEATLDRIDEMNTDHEFQMDAANHNLHIKHCEEFDKYCDALVNTKGLDTGLVAIGIFNKYDMVASVLTGKPADFTVDSAESMVQVAMEAKEGILKRMWEAIKAFFRKLWSFITGKGWNDPKAKIEAAKADIENSKKKIIEYSKDKDIELLLKGNTLDPSKVKTTIDNGSSLINEINALSDKYVAEHNKIESASDESALEAIDKAMNDIQAEIEKKIAELNALSEGLFAKEGDASHEKVSIRLFSSLDAPIEKFISGMQQIAKKLDDIQKKVASYSVSDSLEGVKRKASEMLAKGRQRLGGFLNTVNARVDRFVEGTKRYYKRAASALVSKVKGQPQPA